MHLTQGALALAIFIAASQGLSLSRLIAARAIPITSQAFIAVAFQCSVEGAAIVVTKIVVDTTAAIAPIFAIDAVASLIVAKSNLVLGAMAALAIQGLAELSVELLRSFAKKTLAATVCILAFDCPIELFLLKESLKKGCDGLNGLIIDHFTAQSKLVPVGFVV